MENMAKILIIEDNKDQQEHLAFLLSRFSFEPFVATTGREALLKVEKEALDLIILDLGLQDMDGFEVLKQLKERTRAPVLILSGKHEPEIIAKAMNAGAADYVVKPYHFKKLVSRINHVIRDHCINKV